MTHKTGAYLGGIRSVECLRQRSRMDADTGCWHWGLAVVQASPKVHFVAPDTGVTVSMRGRRAALYLLRGADLPVGQVAFAASRCHSTDCVNPEHATHGDRIAHGQWLRRTGVTVGLASKCAASRRGWEHRRKLTPEAVADIRSSADSNKALAARHGVSQFAVWSARVGKSHRATVAGSSVFVWQPAGNVGRRA